MKEKRKPVLLIILDGWGIAPASRGNAITLAKTPTMDFLNKKFPHSLLKASGKFVGLPPHQDGNSEAGHMNIGAGRIVNQDSSIISHSINDGTFFKNPAFMAAVNHVKRNKSHLHLMGLLCDNQSAHADPDHLLSLLIFLRKNGITNSYLHLFTDGRDSSQHAAIGLIKNIEKILLPEETIATIIGRFYAMDRKKAWSRTELAYNAMVLGRGHMASSPHQAIQQAYNKNQTDEFIIPTIVKKNGLIPPKINDNDAIIFFNLRSDRARQLTKVFVQKQFNKLNPGSFLRKKILNNIVFVAMTDFGPDLDNVLTAYPSQDLLGTLPMALKNLTQLYIAETEKYAHITYFLNGGYSDPVANEDRVLIDSPKVKSYALQPEMSARKIVSYVLKKLRDNAYDFITINFANPDMVGHTGDLRAGIKAVECVDQCLGQIVKLILKKEGSLFITADHGNIEEMINLKTGEIDTKHSSNPVPFIFVNDKKKKVRLKKNGVLGNIAPTLLNLMQIEKPKEIKLNSLCHF